MSVVNTVAQNGAQLASNYDLTKLFLGANRYRNGTFKNTSEASVTLVAGTLLGKVTKLLASNDPGNVVGNLLPYNSTGANGENIPVGILTQDITVSAGASLDTVNYCFAGDFDLGGLILANGTDTLDTVVLGEAIREQIVSNTFLIGVVVSAMAKFDNQPL